MNFLYPTEMLRVDRAEVLCAIMFFSNSDMSIGNWSPRIGRISTSSSSKTGRGRAGNREKKEGEELSVPVHLWDHNYLKYSVGLSLFCSSCVQRPEGRSPEALRRPLVSVSVRALLHPRAPLTFLFRWESTGGTASTAVTDRFHSAMQDTCYPPILSKPDR